MRTVEIDFEVYKEITIRRSSEDVTPNDVIRELLGLPKVEISANEIDEGDSRKSWTIKKVTFPHGTKFRANYKGQSYHAAVVDGALFFNGEKYSSPSSAAMSITGNPVNGWIFWECKMPGEQSWEMLKKRRKTT